MLDDDDATCRDGDPLPYACDVENTMERNTTTARMTDIAKDAERALLHVRDRRTLTPPHVGGWARSIVHMYNKVSRFNSSSNDVSAVRLLEKGIYE